MRHKVTSFNTKKALAKSLKKYMRIKSFSKITISDIISDCGVNRKTFYYHFEDINALLKWMFQNEVIEVVNQFNIMVDYQEAILFIMNYIEENDYIMNCAYTAIGLDEMKRLFAEDFKSGTLSVIENAEKEFGKVLDEEYKAFLCSFFSDALAGSLADWTKHHKRRNKQQTIDYLANTLNFSLTGILNNA